MPDLKIIPLTQEIGAEVRGVDLSKALGETVFPTLYQA